MKTTSSERRLHPLSIVFEIATRLPRLVVPLIVLFVATRPLREAGLPLYLWVAGVAAVALVLSVVRYLRFTYRYGTAELVIRSGLLTRNERIIPYVRIQNLDAAQNPLHRLFDVAVVHVQTGGGAEPEASLRVLPTSALLEMRERVLAAGGRTGGAAVERTDGAADERTDGLTLETRPSADTEAVSPADQPRVTSEAAAGRAASRTLLALAPGDLLLAGFIENRGMVLIFGALALLQQTGTIERFVERAVEDDAFLIGPVLRWLNASDLPVFFAVLYGAAALLVILLFIRLLSTVWALVRLHNFRLERVGDELHTEYGLFTRVSATIPLRRVQTVIVHDGLLHRLFGRRAVVVETAGGAAIETGARQREPIAPILRVEQLPALLRELQPDVDPAAIEWRPVHPRAFGRMLRGSLVWPIALSLAAVVLVQQWAIAVFAVLLARAVVRARLRARHLAWGLTRDSVVVRDGALTRATRFARFNRVQVVALGRNPFDLRTGMASVRADTAGARGGVVVPYLPEATAAALQRELAARTEATAFTW
jgi:putative membrane protein